MELPQHARTPVAQQHVRVMPVTCSHTERARWCGLLQRFPGMPSHDLPATDLDRSVFTVPYMLSEKYAGTHPVFLQSLKPF